MSGYSLWDMKVYDCAMECGTRDEKLCMKTGMNASTMLFGVCVQRGFLLCPYAVTVGYGFRVGYCEGYF